MADINRARRDSKKGEIVFSVTANNEGANAKELFPASLAIVISVRGTFHTSAFVKKYNLPPRPQKQGSFLYGTLGKCVPYDFGDPSLQMSGCFIATPILAGIATIVMQYVNSSSHDTMMKTKLRSKDGILQVLYHNSEEDSSALRYVTPWEFFALKDEDRLATIRHALAAIEQ